MNNVEADEILQKELTKFRHVSYEELAALVDTPKRTTEVSGLTGTVYYLDILICWDGNAGDAVRVIGTINDGGLRAFVPRRNDFIKAPDGSFVGED